MPTRFTALLLGLVLLPLPAAAQERPAGKTVRLLTVGNSFSENATRYLAKIAEADGNVLVLRRCDIGGAGPGHHLAKAAAFDKDPKDKTGLYAGGKSLAQELAAGKWDVVTIQQASAVSHDVASYRPGMKGLHDYIRKHAPASEVVIHQTWAYRADDPRFGGRAEPRTQKAMYDGLATAYRTIAKEVAVRRLPVGDAFYAADTDPTWGYKPDPGFDPKAAVSPALPDQAHSLHVGWRWATAAGRAELQYDGRHAGPAGEYLGGLVFYECLYGRTAVGNAFRPAGVDAGYARFLQEVAHKAVEAAK